MTDDPGGARPRSLDALTPVAARPGLRFRVLVGPQDGVQNLFVGEAVAEPGVEVPPHQHTVTEAIVVLEGTVTIRVGEQTLEVGAGQTFAFPPGVPHTLANRGDTAARFLATAPWDHATYSEVTTYLGESGPAQ